ncbi:hypothetical protein H4S08_004662 [Coemansia sp. RSA 1365]|nr:hypothetical protein H4S08_004662 [Coemansia sp. RSA 1365]
MLSNKAFTPQHFEGAVPNEQELVNLAWEQVKNYHIMVHMCANAYASFSVHPIWFEPGD